MRIVLKQNSMSMEMLVEEKGHGLHTYACVLSPNSFFSLCRHTAALLVLLVP